jgi:hypothetical protein
LEDLLPVAELPQASEGNQVTSIQRKKTMTPKEAAAELHGSQYRNEGSNRLFKQMKDAGLVAAFGASDDLLEFRGAIYDEVGAWDGTTAYVQGGELLQRKCDNEQCPHEEVRIAAAKKSATVVEAVWTPRDGKGEVFASWLIKSNVPHETFDVMEDGELYCRGIVFRLEDTAA